MKESKSFGFDFDLWSLIQEELEDWKHRNREVLIIVLSLTPLYLRFCLQCLSSCHGGLLVAIGTRLHNITNRNKKKQVWTKWKDTQCTGEGEKYEADIKYSSSQSLIPPLPAKGKSTR